MKARLALLLLLSSLVWAQEPETTPERAPEPVPGQAPEPVPGQAPEPGRVPIGEIEVGTIKIRPQTGNADVALKRWIEAHRLQQEHQIPKALAGYLAFLGMPGHRALPERYAELARRRVEAIHTPVRESYEAACKLYAKDRHKALDAWRTLATRWADLPEGAAAQRLVHSDLLRDAIQQARSLKRQDKQKRAAALLENAVRANTRAIYLYEARKLLIELGGPDLRPKDKQRDEEDEDEADGPEADDDGESEIEIND